jgi:hypothetical protein
MKEYSDQETHRFCDFAPEMLHMGGGNGGGSVIRGGSGAGTGNKGTGGGKGKPNKTRGGKGVPDKISKLPPGITPSTGIR